MRAGPVLEGPGLGGPACDGPVCGAPAWGALVCGGPACDGPVLEGPVCGGPAGPVWDGLVWAGPEEGRGLSGLCPLELRSPRLPGVPVRPPPPPGLEPGGDPALGGPPGEPLLGAWPGVAVGALLCGVVLGGAEVCGWSARGRASGAAAVAEWVWSTRDGPGDGLGEGDPPPPLCEVGGLLLCRLGCPMGPPRCSPVGTRLGGVASGVLRGDGASGSGPPVVLVGVGLPVGV